MVSGWFGDDAVALATRLQAIENWLARNSGASQADDDDRKTVELMAKRLALLAGTSRDVIR
ncbi:hypothetical protein [Bradyrhizobium sp. CCGUVB14]|uniref:hypothetical protein n=1 Tax=Bradyrhizobium sp. CCGUVB14 TaxID=2949628 RepID=UPI0020B3A358|nr:hypothetical protein [Bradyrhizobium sp. CCGUVB14]MCP3442234.1 hypothetical protein [Bradyrhizobium sp. CCGUVB14]